MPDYPQRQALGLIMPYVVSENFGFDWNFAYTGDLPA